MLFITKNATIKLVKKNTIDSWRESGRNHEVRLIRQVQQLSHTREQKPSLQQSYAVFAERETQQKICVLQAHFAFVFTLVVVRIINMSRS